MSHANCAQNSENDRSPAVSPLMFTNINRCFR